MVANSEMNHKSKITLEVMRGLVFDCSTLCYCMKKHPLHVTPR